MADDPRSVAEVIALRERFGRMDASKLWPPPADEPYYAHYTRVFAASGDGKRALLCSEGFAWRVDLSTMVASRALALPGEAEIMALSHDGSVAAFLANNTLYRWDVDSDPTTIQSVWSVPGLGRADTLRMSADGATAIVATLARKSTVRVFDLDARTMTFSLEVDADECLLLHPGGRHFIAFGDDGVALFYGEKGLCHQLERCSGGAISPDGTKLLTNSLDARTRVLVYPLKVEGAEMRVGLPQDFTTGAIVATWNFAAVFSPSGKRALLKPSSGTSILLDLQSRESSHTCLEFRSSMAFLADESLAMSPGVSANALGVRCEGVALAGLPAEEPMAILCATRNDPPILSAITTLGLYGSIESDARYIKAEGQKLPYERPELMSALLQSGSCKLERDAQHHFDEMCARRDAWLPFYEQLTVDIESRQLMEINRGLIALTPEIVHRASLAVAGARRFGPPQVSLAALQDAAYELGALATFAREQVFATMVRRMRGNAPSSARPTPDSDPPQQGPTMASEKAEEQNPIDESDDHARPVAANRNQNNLSASGWFHATLLSYLTWGALLGAAGVYYSFFY